MNTLTLLASILTIANSIEFHYQIKRYQMQCFHESVEKDSRYQIALKGNSSTFYLHVIQGRPVHEDTRTINAELKQYSAFASNDCIVTFCIGNLGESLIRIRVQFFHGFYLENEFSAGHNNQELLDLSRRWSQLLNLTDHNYHNYRKQLSERKHISQRVTVILVLMVAVVVISTMTIKFFLSRKLIKYLKYKKIV